MERAGFVGMTRRVHQLVKQAPRAKPPPGLSQSTHVSLPESQPIAHSALFDEATLRNLSTYVKSCGGKMEETANLPSPDELRNLVDTPHACNPNSKDCFGWTLLHHAAYSFPVETIRRLLTLRADPNAVNCLGRTPLHIAAIRDDFEGVVELLSFGANPNIGDCDGWTPVHFAVHSDSLKTLSAFLRFAPDFQAINLSQKTPKDYIRSETLGHAIHSYEQPKDDSPNLSRDSIETSDMSLTDGRLLHGENAIKTDSFKRCLCKERRDPVTIVRAQRPNEESGAIVSPHPNSAYS